MKQALVVKRYNLLDNAYNFINESLICYKRSKKDATTWPFAVFTLIQGIELLSKQILKQQHELLIYENIDNPKNTVSLALAVERLSRVSNKLIDEKEKALLQKALKYRNIILHYEFDLNSKQFRNIYTQLFEFVHYFHHRHIAVELHSQIQKQLWATEAEIMEYFKKSFIVYNGLEVDKAHPAVIQKYQKLNSLLFKGKIIPRIPYGNESWDWQAEKYACHDCAVVKGQYHTDGCDVEECPICKQQFLSCGCECERYIRMPKSDSRIRGA